MRPSDADAVCGRGRPGATTVEENGASRLTELHEGHAEEAEEEPRWASSLGRRTIALTGRKTDRGAAGRRPAATVAGRNCIPKVRTVAQDATEALRADVKALGALWERSKLSSTPLRQVMLRFCYLRNLMSSLYGVTWVLLCLLGNGGFALLFLQADWSRRLDGHHWIDGLQLVLGGAALALATRSEAQLRVRYAAQGQRAEAVA
eukprot:g16778.t1